MTLNINMGGFIDFLGNFGLRDTFQERIAPNSLQIDLAPNSLQIDQDKLNMKFSALNVDFNGPSLDLLHSRKPAHEGIKKRYPLKVVI